MKRTYTFYNRLLLLSLILIILILFSVRIGINRYYDRQSLEMSVIDSKKPTEDQESGKNQAQGQTSQEASQEGTQVSSESTADSKIETEASGKSLQSENKKLVPLTLERLNSLTKTEWMSIKGIGDKTSDLILSYQAEHGDFKSFEDLLNIKGIGEKKLQTIKESQW